MDNVIQEDPLTCDLRVGDTVEVLYDKAALFGSVTTVTRITRSGKTETSNGGMWGARSSLKLISRAGAPVQHSPAKPEPALKKDEFSERGVLPSDVEGINEMVKRMFKEKRDETKPAPVKPTSHAGLLITASEKYLGLGFNDEMGAP